MAAQSLGEESRLHVGPVLVSVADDRGAHFLEKVDPEVAGDLKASDLKKKLDALREQHLQLQYELERAEKMLKVQVHS